jgi:hypothetical protein
MITQGMNEIYDSTFSYFKDSIDSTGLLSIMDQICDKAT